MANNWDRLYKHKEEKKGYTVDIKDKPDIKVDSPEKSDIPIIIKFIMIIPFVIIGLVIAIYIGR